MPIELKIPSVGESITEVAIGGWLKNPGDRIAKDEPVVTLESEKATVELPAPEAGTISKILKRQGESAKVGEVIGYLEKDGAVESSKKPAEKKPVDVEKTSAPKEEKNETKTPVKKTPVAEQKPPAEKTKSPAEEMEQTPKTKSVPAETGEPKKVSGRQEEIVPMNLLRRTVARRLVEAQHNAALLTTFNEIDMSAVISLRKEFGETFQKKNNIKLGFMSFFAKAVVAALKDIPAVNAEIDGTDIIYKNHYDLGIAVGTEKGLVVPV
ncbi:MAG: 2-oxo acid dehydrogenase subunit E2, partial [Limisphaerales bacterium]